MRLPGPSDLDGYYVGIGLHYDVSGLGDPYILRWRKTRRHPRTDRRAVHDGEEWSAKDDRFYTLEERPLLHDILPYTPDTYTSLLQTYFSHKNIMRKYANHITGRFQACRTLDPDQYMYRYDPPQQQNSTDINVVNQRLETIRERVSTELQAAKAGFSERYSESPEDLLRRGAYLGKIDICTSLLFDLTILLRDLT